MMSSPSPCGTGSDSPVRLASLSSRPALAMSVPSAGTSSPVRSSMRSSCTTSVVGTTRTSPSRTTRVVGALSSASRSSFRFARYSCTMPIAELTTRTMPKSPSANDPVTMTSSEERAEDRVEAGQHVGADDLADRARRALGQLVDGPARDPLGHLGARQPLGSGQGRPARVGGVPCVVTGPLSYAGCPVRGGPRHERSGGVARGRRGGIRDRSDARRGGRTIVTDRSSDDVRGDSRIVGRCGA